MLHVRDSVLWCLRHGVIVCWCALVCTLRVCVVLVNGTQAQWLQPYF